MMTKKRPAFTAMLLAFALVSALVSVIPSASAAESRGELLYSTHCVSCHTSEVHWRDNKTATDWAGLMFQVRRWQSVGALAWSEADILEVARYLNESIYHFVQTGERLSAVSRPIVSVPSDGFSER